MTDPHWKILSSALVTDNPYVRVRRDIVQLPHDGPTLDWYVIEGSPSVSIFALTSRREVILIRIYRHPLGRWVYELPSGGVADGMTPLAAAQAELTEETGWQATMLEEIGQFAFQPAHMARLSHVFYTQAVTPGIRTSNEAAEADIEVVLVSLPQLVQMLRDGTMLSMPSVAAIYHALTIKNLWPETLA